MQDNSKGSRKNKLAFWRERRAGRCEAPATQAMSVHIVEARQRSRCPPAAAPRRAAVTNTLVMFQLRSKMPNYSCASP